VEELVKYLKALVYLQAQQIGSEDAAVKAEVLLALAGLSYKEIAAVLDKNEMAVAKAVNRAKHAKRKGGKNE
jgi:hypothetical protein